MKKILVLALITVILISWVQIANAEVTFYYQNLDASTVLSEACIHPSASATLISCYAVNYTLPSGDNYNLTSVSFRLKRLGTLSDAYFAVGIWEQGDVNPETVNPIVSSTARLGDTFSVNLELAKFEFPEGYTIEVGKNYAYGLYCINGTVSISPVHYIQLVYTTTTTDTTCNLYRNSAWVNYTVMDVGFALHGSPITVTETTSAIDGAVFLALLGGMFATLLTVLILRKK